jgi:hypothetical protein
MSLDPKVTKRMERALNEADGPGATGPRLVDDARRLWHRVQQFIALGLIPAVSETDALELACYALQLPFRRNKAPGKLGRTNLKERAEQAAEMLVGLLGGEVDELLLDRSTRLLQELPHRSPMLDEAKLLADAVNLDDFGITGLFLQAIQLARQGDGLHQLIEGAEKREQYGYWDARLKDGFHFEIVRQMAQQRLDNARAAVKLLLDELP